MPSGKQTSFEFGEVSPTLQFRSDAVSYASGLSKLKNMFVRREGGTSNRPGFKFVKEHPNQVDIPDIGGNAGIKGFTFWDTDNNEWKTIEYFNGNTSVSPEYKFSINGGSPLVMGYYDKILAVSPDKIKFNLLKDRIFITPEATLYRIGGAITRKGNMSVIISGVYSGQLLDYIASTNFVTAISTFTTLSGYVLFTGTVLAPVSYLVTAVLKDGQEIFVTEIKTDANPASVKYPSADLMSFIELTFPAALVGVKYFSLYRATGNEGVNSGAFFKLAGRSFYNNALVVKFTDFGAEDASITPPLDVSTLVKASLPVNDEYLGGAQTAAYHQQRLIMGMKPGTTDTIKSGDMVASKLGATEQIKAPVIYSDTGSFQFSIPVTDGTPVIALLAMQNLIAFTEKAVYVVRGGESVGQGVLTPTSVTPILISDEGSSTIVEPKMSGNRGYYINSSHTKLMTIEFGTDGNLGIAEASIFSSHFLLEDIVQIEVLGNGENFLYLLRRDGKLVQITTTEQGRFGHALVETNGYIESIFKGKARREYAPNVTDYNNSEKFYDVLMAYVIRNDIRTLEQLVVRDDRHHEGEFFADCFSSFGQRLSIFGPQGYASSTPNYTPNYMNGRVNIVGASYDAGDTVTIQCDSAAATDDFVLHFFYDDAEGNKQFLRFISDGNPGVLAGPYNINYQGAFTSDVPASLQNVNAQSISQKEKNKRLTRWLPAFKTIVGDASDNTSMLYGQWLACSSDTSLANESIPVSVMADGEVISSPLNPNKPTLYIEKVGNDLTLELPDYYSFGYVGAPIECEFESLDLETSDTRTLTDANKLINAVGVGFNETRGGFYGIPEKELTDMEEINTIDDENINNQAKNINGYLQISFPTEYNRKGRVSIKHVDPTPISILSIYPKGISGE